MIEEVDVMMRELLDLEIHMATHQDALNGLHQQIIRGQPVVCLTYNFMQLRIFELIVL
jgi:hypothetical protein